MSSIFASCFSENLCASSDLSRRVVYLLEWSSLLSGKESLDVERLMPFQAFSVLGRCQAADIGGYVCFSNARSQIILRPAYFKILGSDLLRLRLVDSLCPDPTGILALARFGTFEPLCLRVGFSPCG